MSRILAIAAAAAIAAGPATAEVARYPGWTYVGSTDAMDIYSAPAAAQGGYAHLWVRYEIHASGEQATDSRSVVELTEIDCAKVQSRRVRGTNYSGGQLSGERAEVGPESEWGGVNPALVAKACR